MNEFLMIKLLHLVGLAYWLGGDLGVFCSSFFVTNEKLSADARITAAKILFVVDQGPRISMTLMLPLGTHLAWRMGVLPIDATAMAIIWLLAIGWLAMVITLHTAAASKATKLLTTFDFWFRASLSLGLIIAGAYSLVTESTAMPYWIAAKLVIFGGLVGCGLFIRIKLRPFGPAFANLAQGRVSDADNEAVRSSLGSTRPIVVSIWIGLLASAALGLHLI